MYKEFDDYILNPFSFNNLSSSRSSRRVFARNSLFSRVSRPWIVFAAAQRCRPASVFASLDLPP